MKTYDVLFLRQVHDHVFDGRETTLAERFEQMAAEFREFDPDLTLRLRASMAVPSYDDEREVMLVTVEFDGDVPALVEYLQEAYDDAGVAGFFEVARP